MIPIFSFFSFTLALGILGTLFPGLFPAAGNTATAAGHVAIGIYRRTRNFVQAILIYGTLSLLIWFGALAGAIYASDHNPQRWPWAIFGLVSTGVTFLAVAIVTHAVNAVITGSLSHINTWVTAWSAGIPTRAMSWSAQPRWMKWVSLLMSPFYGLYLITVLPIKGVLELAAAVTAFGPTLGKWMQRLVTVQSAVTTCSFFLSTLALFQLQFPIFHILDMTTLGLSLLFIGILIALLLMTNRAMVNVLDFIQQLGFIALFLIPVIGLGHVAPGFTGILLHNLTTLWTRMLGNAWNYEWVGILVVLLVFAGISYMPWTRRFAGGFAIGLLLLWALSTDLAPLYQQNPAVTPFYMHWEWWTATILLFVAWLVVRNWKAPIRVRANNNPAAALAATGTPTPAPAGTPAAPATPATPAPASGQGHGHGHGGGGFSWPAFAIVALIAVVILGIIFAVKTSTASTAVVTAPAPAAASTPPPAPAQAPVPAAPAAPAVDPDWAKKSHANVSDPNHAHESSYDFKVLGHPAENIFVYQFDARIKLEDQYLVDGDGPSARKIAFAAGDRIAFKADPNYGVWEYNAPYAGPEGQPDHLRPMIDWSPAEQTAYRHFEYPCGDAVRGELCAIIGDVKVTIGLGKTYTVPTGSGVVYAKIGPNIRDRFADRAHGGNRVTITIN